MPKFARGGIAQLEHMLQGGSHKFAAGGRAKVRDVEEFEASVDEANRRSDTDRGQATQEALAVIGGVAGLGVPAVLRSAALMGIPAAEAVRRFLSPGLNKAMRPQLSGEARIAPAVRSSREYGMGQIRAGATGAAIGAGFGELLTKGAKDLTPTETETLERYISGKSLDATDLKILENILAPVEKAQGGPLNLLEGGYADGPTDGQADEVPAKLSHGEYVIDAATVALLGGGNNEAGAKKLDKMRHEVRRRATGSIKQPRAVKGSPLSLMS